MIWDIELTIRLLLAALLGGLIGIERETLNKSAGFRTHILVCIGSCLIMIVSISIYMQYHTTVNADPGRIAAQVVNGIGFLGAGAIIRSGSNVRGLTTAATLWVVAGLGLAVGAGVYVPAIMTTILVFVSLVYFSKVEEKVSNRKRLYTILLTLEDSPGQIGLVCSTMKNLEINIQNIVLKDTYNNLVSLEVLVKIPISIDSTQLVYILENINGVNKVKLM